ncbi:MAG: HNH endonuclease [Acidobacteria bacterium]|nr:MAG: HNH endonuclease [Acidobacteriota bacterium]
MAVAPRASTEPAMPTAPGRACGFPGCHRLSELPGDPLCSVHRLLREMRRGSARARGYDAAWDRRRRQVLHEEPWCRLCLAAGRRTPSVHVDHIKPKSDGGTDDRDNLRGLCPSCHNRRTAIDSSGWGRRRDLA